MVSEGKKLKKVLDNFNGRWGFMKTFLEKATDENSKNKK